MIKANKQYVGFDDRLFMLIAIPVVSILTPVLFFGIKWSEYASVIHQEVPESFVFTLIFWLFNRTVLIRLRKKYGALSYMTKRFYKHFLIVALATPVITLTIASFFRATYAYFAFEDCLEITFAQGVTATYFISISILAFYEAMYFFFKYKEAIIEKEQLQQAHIQSQLDNLRNQINPHFLFNSLNTLMNLIPTDPDKAMNYLSKLSRFYRYAVGNREQASVPIHTELKNLEIYADLLRERFAKSIEIELPKVVEKQGLIPPLSLQMLLENAIKHNIVSKNKPLHISINIDEEGEYIWIRNNIQRKIQAVESTGMGLGNIKKRLSFFTEKPVEIHQNDSTFVVGLPLISSDSLKLKELS